MQARILKSVSFCSLFFFFSLVLSPAVNAQKTALPDITLYAAFTKISVPPGQVINYSIDVINNTNAVKNIDLSVAGLPRRWTYSLKYSGWNIRQIAVLPKEKKTVSLQVTVPIKINKGAYTFHVNAKGLAVLPLTVAVSQEGTYKTTFTTDQPSLEGAANSTFTFNAQLKNETVDTQLYALDAQPPPGWNIDFKAGYKQVASVNVNANQMQNITIDVKPADQVAAGTYKIPVLASAGNTSAGLELAVTVKGSYAMELSTPTGLLSTDVTAGNEKNMELVVRNTGSAPLKNISLSAASPVNWSVNFNPQKIDGLQPGDTAQVQAVIKADKNAIAGDYVTSLEAQAPGVSSKADIRVSVQTAALWGWIGILIILVALGSVYYLFRKYGRR